MAIKRAALTIDEGIENELAVFLDQIVDVPEDTTVEIISLSRPACVYKTTLTT